MQAFVPLKISTSQSPGRRQNANALGKGLPQQKHRDCGAAPPPLLNIAAAIAGSSDSQPSAAARRSAALKGL